MKRQRQALSDICLWSTKENQEYIIMLVDLQVENGTQSRGGIHSTAPGWMTYWLTLIDHALILYELLCMTRRPAELFNEWYGKREKRQKKNLIITRPSMRKDILEDVKLFLCLIRHHAIKVSGDWWYFSMHSRYRHLMEVSDKLYVPAALSPEKEPPIPISWDAEWAPELVCTQ
jgi:hypothetical protein